MDRQYIGARYVPKFSTVNDGVWDNKYTYETLEIVKHNNDFYTSKKPVPVGIDIANTEYWVLTGGNYAEEIQNLNTRVTTAENNITILASTLNIVGADIDAINRDATNFVRLLTGIN